MSDLGFEHLSMEPVVGEEGDYVLREEDWPTLEKEYETLADIYLQRQKDGWGEKFNFFHFRMDLYRGPCMQNVCVAVGLVMNIWLSCQMEIFIHVTNL